MVITTQEHYDHKGYDKTYLFPNGFKMTAVMNNEPDGYPDGRPFGVRIGWGINLTDTRYYATEDERDRGVFEYLVDEMNFIQATIDHEAK